MSKSATRAPFTETSICSFPAGRPKEIAVGRAVKLRFEDVVAIGGEDVDDGDTAAAFRTVHLRRGASGTLSVGL